MRYAKGFLQKSYRGACTRSVRVRIIGFLLLVIEAIIRWSTVYKMELHDWHTANISFRNTAPPSFVLIDYDKNKYHETLGERSRMKKGIESFHRYLTGKGLKEPWSSWVKEIGRSIDTWWKHLAPWPASSKEIGKLTDKFTAVEHTMPPDPETPADLTSCSDSPGGSGSAGSAGVAKPHMVLSGFPTNGGLLRMTIRREW